MKQARRLLRLGAALAVVFAGCSHRDDSAPNAKLPSAASSTTVTTTSDADGRAAFDAEAAKVPKFELTSVPNGYGPGEPRLGIGVFTMTYPATTAVTANDSR